MGFSEGLARVIDENMKQGFIDKTGTAVIPCQWNEAGVFSEGLLRVLDENKKFGYIDKAGQIVIPCQWNGAGDFSEGLASVEDENGKCGFIDKTGNVVIPCQWDHIEEDFRDGVAVVMNIRNGSMRFYDMNKNGKVIGKGGTFFKG
jgi:ribosome biogenesis protein Tsr3